MGIELEVKVLDIDIDVEKKKILNLGGKFVREVSQQLYTYDLPSIWGRYQEIIAHLLDSPSQVGFDVNYEKLKILFLEIDNLVTQPNFSYFNSNSIKKFSDILQHPNWIELLTHSEFLQYLKSFDINPHKWIRLRKTNNLVTLAVKHILADTTSPLQQLLETEINVSSFEETDLLLQQLGFTFKSYQEKRRIIFELRGHEIDFDFWPGIPPYMEIEGKSEEDLLSILNTLGYSLENTISCTADAIYKLYGKNMLENRRLTFSNDEIVFLDQ